MSDDFDPEYGTAVELQEGLRRIVAPNPSPMTFLGTNTYLLGESDIIVIDPGPDHKAHLNSILDAISPRQHISRIIVTHSHLDHSPLARPLSAISGAPILASAATVIYVCIALMATVIAQLLERYTKIPGFVGKA